jgi:hypothetical protein
MTSRLVNNKTKIIGKGAVVCNLGRTLDFFLEELRTITKHFSENSRYDG